VTAIEFRMEQQGLTRKHLEPMIGSRARVSEVLNRKRSLTIGMIRRVRSALGISADLLVESEPRKRAVKRASTKNR
jgi:HTH-type transcriptional regulator / antitoxin HigA